MENHKAIKQQDYSGILGGADSFTVTGASGIGKSSSITRAIQLLTKEEIIEIEKPPVSGGFSITFFEKREYNGQGKMLDKCSCLEENIRKLSGSYG